MANAIKFTEHGEIVVQIAGTAREGGRTAISVSVQDTGIGVAPGKQALIFESFSQGDASMTRRFGGTGLGLTISAKLVRLMGGEIRVQSELGEGSTSSFVAWFGLPWLGRGCRILAVLAIR